MSCLSGTFILVRCLYWEISKIMLKFKVVLSFLFFGGFKCSKNCLNMCFQNLRFGHFSIVSGIVWLCCLPNRYTAQGLTDAAGGNTA